MQSVSKVLLRSGSYICIQRSDGYIRTYTRYTTSLCDKDRVIKYYANGRYDQAFEIDEDRLLELEMHGTIGVDMMIKVNRLRSEKNEKEGKAGYIYQLWSGLFTKTKRNEDDEDNEDEKVDTLPKAKIDFKGKKAVR